MKVVRIEAGGRGGDSIKWEKWKFCILKDNKTEKEEEESDHPSYFFTTRTWHHTDITTLTVLGDVVRSTTKH